MRLLPYKANGGFLGLRFQSSSESRHQSRRMTPLMFCTYQLFQYPNQFKTIFRGGRSFQQYVFDQFCKFDSEGLEYLSHNHDLLRVADFTSLCEQLRDPKSTENEEVAVLCALCYILASTYVRADLYIWHNMHDFISIPNEIGYPDMFLTTTCNHEWLDIRNALLPEQRVMDCLDIAARVFHINYVQWCLSLLMRKYSEKWRPAL